MFKQIKIIKESIIHIYNLLQNVDRYSLATRLIFFAEPSSSNKLINDKQTQQKISCGEPVDRIMKRNIRRKSGRCEKDASWLWPNTHSWKSQAWLDAREVNNIFQGR